MEWKTLSSVASQPTRERHKHRDEKNRQPFRIHDCDNDREWQQGCEQNRFCPQPEIFVGLSRSLLEPFAECGRKFPDEEIVGVPDMRLCPGEMPNQLFVVEQDIAIIIPGAEHESAEKSAGPRIISGPKSGPV